MMVFVMSDLGMPVAYLSPRLRASVSVGVSVFCERFWTRSWRPIFFHLLVLIRDLSLFCRVRFCELLARFIFCVILCFSLVVRGCWWCRVLAIFLALSRVSTSWCLSSSAEVVR